MKNKGFTLIELLAVIVVLALILAIAIPAITGIITETKKKAMISDAKLVIKTLNLRKLESDTFDITGIDQTNIETDLSIDDENYNVLVIKYKNEKPYITIEGKNKWDGLTVYGYFDDMQVINSDEYDVVPPTLSIIGLSELTIEQGGTYHELGVLAEDNQDTNIQSKVITTGSVDTSKLGTYTIKYNVEDLTGNTAVEKVRTIHVVAPANPEIAFGTNGNNTYEKTQSTTVLVTDNVAVNTASLKYLWSTSTSGIVEGDFTSTFSNNTEITTPANLTGNYYLWILAKDLSGNTTISRSDVFKLDNTAPTSATATIGIITSNSIIVSASGTDNETAITEYQFSKDNGVTWTNKGTSDTYQFNNLTSGTYQLKVRVYNAMGYSLDSDSVDGTTSTIPTPTFSISPTGWATSKTVTVDYGTSEYTKQYSIDGGSTWITSTGQTQNVIFNDNGSVIARITDGINTKNATTYNVTQIDITAPTISFGTNGNTTYAKLHSTTVTVSDNGAVDTTSLKYLWSTSSSGITEANITTSFTNSGTINSSGQTGAYYLWILAKDTAGNITITKSNVFNIDNTAPVITLNGSSTVSFTAGVYGSTYTDAGATANDSMEGNLTSRIVVSNPVNINLFGTYTVTYNVTDTAGNVASQVERIVNINTLQVEYLVVAGGGGGGWDAGGGGGGGGVLSGTTQTVSTSYAITVGGGGAGGGGTIGGQASNGGNSSAFSVTAIGGGGAGNKGATGRGGGAGGGGGHSSVYAGGAGTSGQGYSGGSGSSTGGGGGGGAGAAGASSTGNGGNGGTGISSSISGTARYYGGGGGGGNYAGSAAGGSGGTGGGGNGGGVSISGSAGSANTGGGGGAMGNASATGGPYSGGSGIVIIRYYGTPKAVGGTITTAGGYTIHTFTSTQTFVVGNLVSVEYLVVGGGGGGGWDAGGGGGGGGVLSGTTQIGTTAYAITVGGGGAGGGGTIGGQASNGGNSSAFLITALGGGGAGNKQANGSGGGSGGGGGHMSAYAGGAGTSGQGYAGGSGSSTGGGGGGGAGAAGASSTGNGGNGGTGISSSISGTARYYGGGGGGGNHAGSAAGGSGGAGGGGNGGGVSISGSAGTANTGGGGGAMGNASATGGPYAGGSGIVIIAYPGTSAKATGGTISTTSRPGYVVHTFTSSGTFTYTG